MIDMWLAWTELARALLTACIRANVSLACMAPVCASCSQIVPADCQRMHAPYDRIVDCLMPLYPALALAANASRPTCILLPPRQTSKPLVQLLEALFGLSTFVMVTDATCTTNLVARSKRNDTDVFAYDVSNGGRWDITASVWRLLHAHIRARILPTPLTPASHLVLVSRGGLALATSKTSRKLIREDGIVRRLQQATELPVRVYRGVESARETLALFATAHAIVGYHGAGLANAVFMPRPSCVVEVSTYMHEPGVGASSRCGSSAWSTARPNRTHGVDEGSAEATAHVPLLPALHDQYFRVPTVQPWRSNRVTVAPWNPLVRWATYRIPLRQVLDGNGWPCERTIRQQEANFRDRTIKMLQWVPLTDHDVDNLAELCLACLGGVAQGAAASESDHAGSSSSSRPPSASPPPYNVQVNFHTAGPTYSSVLSGRMT